MGPEMQQMSPEYIKMLEQMAGQKCVYNPKTEEFLNMLNPKNDINQDNSNSMIISKQRPNLDLKKRKYVGNNTILEVNEEDRNLSGSIVSRENYLNANNIARQNDLNEQQKEEIEKYSKEELPIYIEQSMSEFSVAQDCNIPPEFLNKEILPIVFINNDNIYAHLMYFLENYYKYREFNQIGVIKEKLILPLSIIGKPFHGFHTSNNTNIKKFLTITNNFECPFYSREEEQEIINNIKVNNNFSENFLDFNQIWMKTLINSLAEFIEFKLYKIPHYYYCKKCQRPYLYISDILNDNKNEISIENLKKSINIYNELINIIDINAFNNKNKEIKENIINVISYIDNFKGNDYFFEKDINGCFIPCTNMKMLDKVLTEIHENKLNSENIENIEYKFELIVEDSAVEKVFDYLSNSNFFMYFNDICLYSEKVKNPKNINSYLLKLKKKYVKFIKNTNITQDNISLFLQSCKISEENKNNKEYKLFNNIINYDSYLYKYSTLHRGISVYYNQYQMDSYQIVEKILIDFLNCVSGESLNSKNGKRNIPEIVMKEKEKNESCGEKDKKFINIIMLLNEIVKKYQINKKTNDYIVIQNYGNEYNSFCSDFNFWLNDVDFLAHQKLYYFIGSLIYILDELILPKTLPPPMPNKEPIISMQIYESIQNQMPPHDPHIPGPMNMPPHGPHGFITELMYSSEPMPIHGPLPDPLQNQMHSIGQMPMLMQEMPLTNDLHINDAVSKIYLIKETKGNYIDLLLYLKNKNNVITFPNFLTCLFDTSPEYKNDNKTKYHILYKITYNENIFSQEPTSLSNLSSKEKVFQLFTFYKITDVKINKSKERAEVSFEVINSQENLEEKLREKNILAYNKKKNLMELKIPSDSFMFNNSSEITNLSHQIYNNSKSFGNNTSNSEIYQNPTSQNLMFFNQKYSKNLNFDNTSLNLENSKLYNDGLFFLSKIQFNNVINLNINDNKISDLSPLKNCCYPNLKKLSCSSNKNISLKFKIQDISPLIDCKFPNLLVLNLRNNFISDISYLLLMNFPSLVILDLAYNYIQSIQTFSHVNFPKLESLDLCNNQIYDISPFNSGKNKKKFLQSIDSDPKMIRSISYRVIKSLGNEGETSNEGVLPRLKILKIKHNKIIIDEIYLGTIKALRNRGVTVFK